MAVLNVLIEHDPEQVWQVLSDGWAYAEWVAGTRNIRDVDDRWPEPGARIHYTFGAGRRTLDDVTTVRVMEPCRRLELEAHAGRLGSARVSIELVDWGQGRTVVILDEHPLTGPGARWHSVADDLYLMAHGDRTGRPRLQPRPLGIGLAGALLAELMLAGWIGLRRDSAVVIVPGVPQDTVMRHALMKQIADEPGPLLVQAWLRFLARGAARDVALRLEQAGYLERVRSWIPGRQGRWVPVNPDWAFTGDLTARPGWALLSNQEQGQVLDLGIEYLSVHQLRPPDWAGRKQITGGAALPDWSGTYLLTTLARHDPARVHALEPAMWQKWAPAIVGAWNSPHDDDQRLRCDLTDLAPPDGKQDILFAALDHLDALDGHGGTLPYSLYQHLCPCLASGLAGRLTAGRYSGHLARTLLDLLIEHAPRAALPICRRLHANPAHELAPAAREGLAKLDPSAIVDELDAATAGPGELAEVMPHLAVTGLSDTRLAVLARILLRCFPYAQDQPLQFGPYPPDGQYQVRRFRNLVLERLTEQGQTPALEELARQSGSDADRDSIGWYLPRARERAADLALARPGPAALLRLLSRGDARLIRRARDLVEVMITQLEQLQHELTHQGASREIWDLHGDSATHNNENEITDWIRRKLRSRLTIATTIDREVQVEPKRHGIGTRIDLTVTTPAATHPATAPRVIAEAKLVTDDTLMTAMQDQLIRRYLIPEALQYGIYLIYWIPARQRQRRMKTHTDPAQLLRQLEQQAASAGPDLHIKPFLLDITHK